MEEEPAQGCSRGEDHKSVLLSCSTTTLHRGLWWDKQSEEKAAVKQACGKSRLNRDGRAGSARTRPSPHRSRIEVSPRSMTYLISRVIPVLVLLALSGECAAFISFPFSSCFGVNTCIVPSATSPASRCSEVWTDTIVGRSLYDEDQMPEPFTFFTDDGRMVHISDDKHPSRSTSLESLPRSFRVNSGEFGEFFEQYDAERCYQYAPSPQVSKRRVNRLQPRSKGRAVLQTRSFSMPALWSKKDMVLWPMFVEEVPQSNIVAFSLPSFSIPSSPSSSPDQNAHMLRLRGGSTHNASAPENASTEEDTDVDNDLNVTSVDGTRTGQMLADPRNEISMRRSRPATAADGGRPLRIALFTWESLHTIAVGGVAPHVTELAAGLERRGHEVHVYSRTGDGQLPYEVVDGVHIHRVPIALDPDFIAECNNMCNSFCWFLRESEQFQGAVFDLCHGHDWLAAKAVLQCKNMGRATVATIHSTEYGRCGNVNYGGQSERIRKIEMEVAFVADRVISVSGILCDEVKQQFGISEDKLRMVYNGIHLAPYLGSVDAGMVKARYNTGPLDPVVLFVGRLATQKGPDLLVEAIPLVLNTRSDVKFLIVGDGYLKGDLEKRVHELGVADSVRFLGSMSGRPLVELFKSADCVCIPSRNEPFGIVVLEAWAAGKPVVATSSGGPREFVDHGVDGYHVHPSANSNFENSRQMGIRGRAKAQQKFNWDKIAEDTERIYRELTGH